MDSLRPDFLEICDIMNVQSPKPAQNPDIDMLRESLLCNRVTIENQRATIEELTQANILLAQAAGVDDNDFRIAARSARSITETQLQMTIKALNGENAALRGQVAVLETSCQESGAIIKMQCETMDSMKLRPLSPRFYPFKTEEEKRRLAAAGWIETFDPITGKDLKDWRGTEASEK